MLFEKIKIKDEKEVRILRFSIIYYRKREINGINEKYIDIFPVNGIRESFFEKIKNSFNEQIKTFIFYEHHIGEFYLFLTFLKQYLTENNINNAVLVINNPKFFDLMDMFNIYNTQDDTNLNIINSEYSNNSNIYVMQNSDISEFNLKSIFNGSDIHIYQSYKFIYPQSDNYKTLRDMVSLNNKNINFIDYIAHNLNCTKEKMQIPLKVSISDNVERSLLFKLIRMRGGGVQYE